MGVKDSCKFRPEPVTRSDTLYFFGQRNLIFAGKSQGIFKSDACGYHAKGTSVSNVQISLILQHINCQYLSPYVSYSSSGENLVTCQEHFS